MMTPERRQEIEEFMRYELESYANCDHDTPPYLAEACVDLFAEIDRLKEKLDIALGDFDAFICTMSEINVHNGFSFTQVLMKARKRIQHIKKEKDV